MKQITKNEIYNHYIGLDWSKVNFAMATMRSNSKEPKAEECPSDIRLLKEKLKKLTGKKILTIEETTSTHWLYVELKEYVDRIIICDPHRNKLMNDGPKNDKVDAKKLCLLLRNGSLKEVFHTSDKAYEIRKLVSCYDDYVKASVRIKNQRSAMFLSEGKDHKKEKILLESDIKKFVTEMQNNTRDQLHEVRQGFELMFKKIVKENKTVRELTRVSGIANILAVAIYAIVIDASRFPTKYKYYAYAGLVSHQKESGGRNYGKRRIRHNVKLKSCYKIAANAAIGGNNDIREYYEYLIQNNYSIENARNEIARYIAKVTYGIMKNKTDYRPYQWRESKK